jgi:F0F1-type ATP synthase membrane subunit b/b'
MTRKEKESEIQRLQGKYEQDMKAMREEMKEEMKMQIAQVITKIKPEIVREGLT